MKISRTGSAADHGRREVNLTDPKFGWSKKDESLTIRHSRAKDFSTTAHHSYTITMSASEVNELLAALAKSATAAPEAFEASLAPSLKAIAQLQAVASGLLSK